MNSTEKISDGGPAFPPSGAAYEFVGVQTGMSLRDWLAGQALAGLCANPGGPFQANGMNGWAIVNCTINDVATEALRLADAMLAERNKAAAP